MRCFAHLCFGIIDYLYTWAGSLLLSRYLCVVFSGWGDHNARIPANNNRLTSLAWLSFILSLLSLSYLSYLWLSGYLMLYCSYTRERNRTHSLWSYRVWERRRVSTRVECLNLEGWHKEYEPLLIAHRRTENRQAKGTKRNGLSLRNLPAQCVRRALGFGLCSQFKRLFPFVRSF